MRLLDKFDEFTVQDNSGFKVAFGDIVVSVVCHNHLDAFNSMQGNGLVGKNIDWSKMPRDLMCLTFHNAEVCVFNQKTDENITEQFVEDYSEYDGCGWINPMQLVDVLVKVKEYITADEK